MCTATQRGEVGGDGCGEAASTGETENRAPSLAKEETKATACGCPVEPGDVLRSVSWT